MRIRDRYKFYLVPVLVAISLSLIAGIVTLRQLRREAVANQTTNKIVNAVFALNNIVYEYSRSQIVSRETWTQTSGDLERLLKSYGPRSRYEQQVLDNAVEALNQLSILFDELMALGVFSEQSRGQEFERRTLVIYFLTDSENLVRNALTLSTIESRRQLQVTRRFIMLMLLSVAALVGVIAWSALWLRNTVVIRLEALHRGMRVVADGDLDHRVDMVSPDEFGELAASFDEMTSRLQTSHRALKQSNRELEEYASIASHDLSEPTRTIKSFLQLLERRASDQLDDRCREYLHFAVDGAARMQTLIRDLLEYSKLSTATHACRQLKCAEVIDHAVANLQTAIAEAGAEVTTGELPEIYGDRTQLVQLFQNLIGNGIKFRDERKPRVHITATACGDDWDIQVRDNGIGIADAHATRIFAVFQRLHAAEDYDGTGIGLAVCRRIVDRHNGRIYVESNGDGGGAIFHVVLPAGRQPTDLPV